MNEEDLKMLEVILKKDPQELSDNDKAVLKARRSYVGKTSRRKFAEVFNEPVENKVEKDLIDKLSSKSSPNAVDPYTEEDEDDDA